ncbi:hypothetical protein [Halolamina rubra]|uniref:hypothetical protein n=1 Tax=Halolamina rubra TaxID=1380430 RepID=UPI00067870EE|nr:hypothetical protein [Halolamina rubra]
MADFEIPPAGIRLIRETREEDREEFADVFGVTSNTVGNWERGDTTPREDLREAMHDAIPEDLTLDEVREAEGQFDDQPSSYDNEQRLFGSKWLQTLRDKPRVGEELGDGRGVAVLTDQQRMFVKRLDVTGVGGASHRDSDRVTKVYYLHGDERRALRRFIEENESIVRDQLQDAPNRFSHEWDEWLYGLLEEEFRFWLYK